MLHIGSNEIWIPTKTQGWELGTLIQETADGSLVVEGTDGRKTYSKIEIHRTDPTHFDDLEDLCTMNHLHEAPLLDCLRRRFLADKIYTTTGDVLISINPYKRIPGLYEAPLTYLDTPDDGEVDKTASRPHVYKIANFALVELLYGKKSALEGLAAPRNQSIVVSGESGAGKTEASKYVMNFLIAADQEEKTAGKVARSESDQRTGDAIKRVLLDSNVIFEAFGNAKTVRNDNSSRFGKYIKLQYSEDNRIISAFTETFLLEKSRLMNVGAGERNYHVFYQFLRGNQNPALAKNLYLKDPTQFKMLVDANGAALNSTEDPLYGQLLQALTTLGCSNVEVESLLSLLAALLHIGNISVTMLEEGKEVEIPEEENTESKQHEYMGHARLNSPTMPMHVIAELLGVGPEMFLSRLTTQRVKVSSRRSVTIKRLNEIDIMNNLAGLIKWVYSCAFGWLIKKINFAHCSVSPSDVTKATKFIGILDIFGFEILGLNSFEQLCINFTNERLQQQFNEYVFDREQNIYREEGLDWNAIQYKDNQPVIDLIGKKPNGLLIILEQQGMLNRGSADAGALVSAFNATHASDKSKSPNYEKSRFGTDGKFTIKHFAGDVTYTVNGFLEKNNDSLQEDLMELMVCSTNPFIQNAIVSIGMDIPGNEEEPGFIGDINPDKVVKTAGGSLSMSARAVGDSDAMKRGTNKEQSSPAADSKKMTAVGRRTSAMSGGGGGDGGGGGGAAAGGKKLATTVTVSFQFRSQLDILLATLRATSPHYIKCVKPTALKTPGVFDSLMVLEQLRYSGALEVVRIRQEGFPICLSFQLFYETFELFAFKRGWKKSSVAGVEDCKKYCEQLLKEVLVIKRDYQIGHTKIFMKTDAYENMHLAIAAFLGNKIRKFQALVRKNIFQGKYRAARRGFLKIQSFVRMFLQRQKFRVLVAAERLRIRNDKARQEAERKRIEHEAEMERARVEAAFAAEMKRRAEEEEERLEAERQRLENERLEKEEYEKRIADLHSFCRAGELSQVQSILSIHPEDYHARNEAAHNCTVLHSAVSSGNMDLLKFFWPTSEDLLTKDDLGNNAIHYAILSHKKSAFEMLNFFAMISEVNYDQLKELQKGFSILSIHQTANRKGKQPAARGSMISMANSGLIEQEPAVVEQLENEEDDLKHPVAELKSGWLSKRGESQTWRKRWVVLTTEALMYFRNNKDKLPRDTLSFNTKNDLKIERSPGKATAIDIYVNQQSVVKKRDRISLMADTEQEMQIWLTLLKAAAGVEVQSLRTSKPTVVATARKSTAPQPPPPPPPPAPSGGKPLLLANPRIRSLLFRQTNNHRETALHLLSQYDPSMALSSANEMTLDDMLILASWLIHNYCPIDGFNHKGLTPLQIAVQNGNENLATLMAKQGANLNNHMYGANNKRSTLELTNSVQFQLLLKSAVNTYENRKNTFLPIPPRLRGYHYLSLGLNRLAIEGSE
jgi:myosin heavy subunit